MRHEALDETIIQSRPSVMTAPTVVVTRNMITGQVTDERLIDHNFRSDRQWLGNHLYWALRNDHGVQCAPATESDIKALPVHDTLRKNRHK